MAFGLRYFDNKNEIRLIQISGDGRVRVEAAGKRWWTTAVSQWQVFETSDTGIQTYTSHEQAMHAAKSLSSGET